MTIVVCEDDKDLLGLIDAIVEDMGVNLIKCSDDSSLRKVMETNNVDLLVVDYWLKKIKADEVITEIKIAHPDLPIILMSAIGDLPEVTKKLNVSDYLKKPFDIDLLIKKIQMYLKLSLDKKDSLVA